ncbi:MAG: YkgJ family cysteine cluster protein [Pirellulaceae bacterium]|nr:YkgJ family cysteine cluster protein [Pirellulaceae bacterium]
MDEPLVSQFQEPQLRLLHQVATSCTGCGACCRLTPLPPFAAGECEQHEIPSEWLLPIHERVAMGQQFELLPCVWFDREQQACQHYDQRPTACREFELGGPACVSARWRVFTDDSSSHSID